MVILDTCAILESCKISPAFSKSTLSKMKEGSYLLNISFAEIACKVKLGKLEINVTPRVLYEEFSKIEHIEIISIGVNDWFDSIDLEWDENRDPVDRIITSYACKKGIPIVSTDLKIKKFYKNVIW